MKYMGILKKIIRIIAFVTTTLLLSSCSQNKTRKGPYRQYLTNKLEYVEAPLDYTLTEVKALDNMFQPLNPKNMTSLNTLLKNRENLLWIRVKFELDKPLHNQQIGLFVGHIRSSSTLYLNNQMVRKYGEIPPNESSSGYVAQNYFLQNYALKCSGENEIYIQIWPGFAGSISKDFYISFQGPSFQRAEIKSFFNSRIPVVYLSISLLISFMYSVLFFIIRKYKRLIIFMHFANLNLFTALFMFAFGYADIPWLQHSSFISYLTVLKLSWGIGAFSAIYFASSFIISCFDHIPKKREMIIRVILLVIPGIITLFIPSYESFGKFLNILFLVCLGQMLFAVPHIFKNLKDPKKRKTVIVILSDFIPIQIAVAADAVCRGIFKIDDLPVFSIYGWQFTMYIFLFKLMKQFGSIYIHNSKLKDQLQEFNQNLEQVVAMRTKELSDANYVLSKGLQTVSHVQKNFLPPEQNSFRGWDLSIYYQPVDNNVSGDLYDYYTSENDTSLDGLGIFDVSGHGIPAGLMTILAKGIITQQFLAGVQQSSSMSSVLEEINKTYIKEKVNLENYITGLLFRFSGFNNKDICSVEFANAGHPYPLIYDSEKDEAIELRPDNPEKQYGIIGVEGLDVSFPPVSFRMKPNDIILCFTDGITDARNREEDSFSKKKLATLLKAHKNLPAALLVKAIISEFEFFTNGRKPDDDITLIVLKRNKSGDYIEEI